MITVLNISLPLRDLAFDRGFDMFGRVVAVLALVLGILAFGVAEKPVEAAGNCGSYGTQTAIAGTGTYYTVFCIPAGARVACPSGKKPGFSARVTTTGWINVWGVPKFTTYSLFTPNGGCTSTSNLWADVQREWGSVIANACKNRGAQAVNIVIGASGPYGTVVASVYAGTCIVRTL
jgi:hypothetical protein